MKKSQKAIDTVISPEELVEMGRKWGGPTWKIKLARKIGVDPRTVRRWAEPEGTTGHRKLRGFTAEHVRKVLRR